MIAHMAQINARHCRCKNTGGRNDIMKLYYGVTVLKRIPVMPGTTLEPPGIPGILWARPWDPQAHPWDPPGTSLRPPEYPRGLWTTKTAIS